MLRTGETLLRTDESQVAVTPYEFQEVPVSQRLRLRSKECDGILIGVLQHFD